MKPGMLPEYEVLRSLRRSSPAQAQNILMRSPTRELALTLLSLTDDERQEFYRYLSAPKRRAVEEEISLQRRVRTTPDQRRRMAENLLERFSGRRTGTLSSYLRPPRGRGRRES